LTACDPGGKPATPAQTSLTATASIPTTSSAPAAPSQPQSTQPAPSSQPESTQPAAPPPPETTSPPSRHSGPIQGGEFCKQDEEGWIGVDPSGDEYICRDIDHDGHPHWVKPSAAPSPSQTQAADVVQRYYAAINAKDYATAWALGGQNLGGSYQDFVDGFADTLQDSLTVVSTQGQTVQIELDAEQTDGSHRYYAGTYTVNDGVIVAADVTQR
jgi:hypothetical protein